LLKKEQELVELKGAFPFNAQAIVTKQGEVESYENGKKALVALGKELFSLVLQ